MSDQTPPVRGFVSYARTDNEAFDGIVDRLKKELAGKYFAQTGRRLELFVDRESIGWGADWRHSIRSSVVAATVFIPIVSQSYFASEACREELLAFVDAADELGATDLILPIVIAGSAKITSDHEMDEVRIVERLNHKSVEAAYREGYDSRSWRTIVGEMIDGLERGIDAAEQALIERTVADVAEAETASEDEESPADILKATMLLDESSEQMTRSVDAFKHFSESMLQSAAQPLIAAGTAAQRSAAFVKLAADIKQPAQDFRQIGREAEQHLRAADTEARKILDELAAMDQDFAWEERRKLVATMNSIKDVGEIVDAADRTIAQVQFMAMGSVPFRKAVEPAIEGMRSLRNVMSIVSSWSQMS